MKIRSTFLLASACLSALGVAFAAPEPAVPAAQNFWGPRYNAAPRPPQPPAPVGKNHGAAEIIRHWNEMAFNASGLDHTPVQIGENRVFGEQVGPVRAARALAIVHIAVFDAVNAIENKYKSYTGIPNAKNETSMNCAIAQAAHDTLCAMWPSQVATFDQQLATELAQEKNKKKRTLGIELGKHCAAKVLALRSNDGSAFTEQRVGIEYIPSNAPGFWRQDPISQHPLALGSLWGQVQPLVLQSASQFRCPAPPALNSAEYTAGYNEAMALGGDGVITPTSRTDEQSQIAIFWGYDGTPSLCAPPRLYNQIAIHIADVMGTSRDPLQLARLLALVNVSLSEAGIASWESKWFYQYWRPITAIRESDIGTGPTGFGDGNSDTAGDVNFTPFGAPASNLNGPNFTPPFPAYPSGHATFGGALFETFRNFYGRDDVEFELGSDEFNGVTKDNQGNVRPVIVRRFKSFSQAEEENGQSRIYLGIHWAWDKNEGIAQGRKVADYVFTHAFQKRKGPNK
ncbi:MAG TPA: phosphatase PAP2 family protein [Chthoniobacterales bacterium]|nr:phosphatase PAP2 family protein [Chthoniobacterales bacterium]